MPAAFRPTTESGFAMSSRERISAGTPKMLATTPPAIMTPAPIMYPMKRRKWSVPFADEPALQPGAEGAESLGDAEEDGYRLSTHLEGEHLRARQVGSTRPR